MSNLYFHSPGYISNPISESLSNESKNDLLPSFSSPFKKDELNPLDLTIKENIENIIKFQETPILLNNNNNYILNAKTDEEISKNKISTKKKGIKFLSIKQEHLEEKLTINKQIRGKKMYDMLQKIFGFKIESLRCLINSKINSLININDKEYIKKISSKYYHKSSKEDFIKLLNMTVAELFKQEISGKYNNKKFDKDENKKRIEILYKDYQNKEEWKNISDILESTIDAMRIIYIDNNSEYKNIFNLENDLIKIKTKIEKKRGEDRNYINEIRKISKNLPEFLNEIHSREPKGNKANEKGD